MPGQNGPVEELYRRDGVRLERSLIASFGDVDLAGEAVAEAFAQLLRHRGRVASPQSWVWRAAFAIARGLAGARTTVYGLTPPDSPHSPAGRDLDLIDALEHLSERQRQCVVLHHFAGFSLRETADIAGTTRNAAKVHLSRGRERLRVALRDPLDADEQGDQRAS